MKESVGSSYARQYETRQAARAQQAVTRRMADVEEDDTADDLTVAEEDEDEWYPRMPRSALRLRDTREDPLDATTSRNLSRQQTQAVMVTKRHAVPARSSAVRSTQTEELYRPPRVRLHWFVFVGLALSAMVIGWVLFTLVANWWSNTTNTWTYGYPRTYQCDAVVGHNHDSAANPSHFLAVNLNGKVEVIELPAGDGSHAKIYLGPSLIGPDADLAPVTLSFADVTGDGEVDMLIHVQGSTFVFVNIGSEFRPATPADHVSVPTS